MLQGTAAQQGQLLPSCLNSLPCVQTTYTASAAQNGWAISGGFSASLAQPLSFAGVVERNASFTSFQDIWTQTGSTIGAGFASTANNGYVFAGSTKAAAMTDSVAHSLQIIANGASTIWNVDNAKTTISPGTNGVGGTLTARIFEGSDGSVGGLFFEWGVWGGGFSTAQQTSQCHNAYGYWGLPAAC